MTAGKRRQVRGGFTLIELGVVVLIIGILLTFTVPSFSRVREQNRVDAATQYLRSIWAAERVYWLEKRTFTDSLSTLNSMGLIDPKIAGGTDGGYDYEISDATDSTLEVRAIRSGSTIWSGTLKISEDGEVTGFVANGARVLTPPDI